MNEPQPERNIKSHERIFHPYSPQAAEHNEAHGDAISFCISLSENPAACDLPEKISRLLSEADADDQEYAIGTAYALLVGYKRRKELSAYFTPPILARAAIAAGAP